MSESETESTEKQETAETPAGQEQQETEKAEASTDPWADAESARKEIEKLRKESAGYRTKLREVEPLAAKAKELEDAQKSELERATERAAELEKKAQEANARVVQSEIRAAAAGKLADPRDALTFLSPDQFEVNDDGEVDSEQVSKAIDELLENKPYLTAAAAKRFQGTADNGAARDSGGAKQLTREDLDGMSPQEIVKAKAEGRLNTVLGVK